MNFRDAAVLLLSVIFREIFCLLRFFQRGKKDWPSPHPHYSLFRNKHKITETWSIKWYVNKDFILYCSTEETQMANKNVQNKCHIPKTDRNITVCCMNTDYL